ncbi:Uncharacterised protein [uncultured Megasphaera sp.]|nr:Uncharacterised protein [uncultured Megasphaera sp.]SCJ70989.1 Uncharacterised protein [uncultured Ruminococcus sp.]
MAGFNEQHAIVTCHGNPCRAIQHILVGKMRCRIIHNDIMLSRQLHGIGRRHQAALVNIRFALDSNGAALNTAGVLYQPCLNLDRLSLQHAAVFHSFFRIDHEILGAHQAAVGR